MAIDWTRSMKQTYEFYEVDPLTWGDVRKLDNITSCSITRDLAKETLGSASIGCVGEMAEMYIRVYMIAIQNGIEYKVPLGTFMVQTPSNKFDGKISTVTLDAYTPLLELKDDMPPIGYSVLKNTNTLETAVALTKQHLRAPVVNPDFENTTILGNKHLYGDFVANDDDTWLTFISDLMSSVRYSYRLDEMGRVLFAPSQATNALQPTWEYNDSNSSILLPNVTINRDLYGIPNVVEVSMSVGNGYLYSRVENNDPESPISTTTRGRIVLHRETNPQIEGVPTQAMLDEYAEALLKELSTLEYTVSYSHGYCPVTIGDCVLLNYAKPGLQRVKARVTSQTINCKTGCTVSEQAVYTNKLWR